MALAPEPRRHRIPAWIWCVLPVLIAVVLLYAAGRPPICTCGRIELWHPALDAGNSQMLLDWYSPSHVIHGFLFFWLLRFALPRLAVPRRLAIALGVEALWEVVENSPWIIDRYRAATMALGYTGDSILNSMSDIGCMALGFWIASRLPWWATLALALAFEALTAWTIRDGLLLNILMLVHPIAAVKVWQAG